MTALYNEIDGYAARWLANLIDAGQIAPGRVETRSIADLRPEDVADAVQLHTFAGIGGWSLALRLAGWPDDVSVWTGSCPCQPFSTAGKGGGFSDERHLWPAWFELIRKCRPRVVFGEQVASGAGLAWLDAVFADLEGEGYAVGAADLAAAGVGAPHIRQRLFFVAVADSNGKGPQGRAGVQGRDEQLSRAGSLAGGVADADHERRDRLYALDEPRRGMPQASRRGASCWVGDADRGSAGRLAGAVLGPQGGGEDLSDADGSRDAGDRASAWSDAEWIACRDGRSRPAQPGSFPLAYGVLQRVGSGGAVEVRARSAELRGYGNAIVPQVAAEWIRAVMGAIGMVVP